MPCHSTKYHGITWHHMSCHDMIGYVMPWTVLKSCHGMTFNDMPCHNMSWLIMSWHDTSWGAMPWCVITWYARPWHATTFHGMTCQAHDTSCPDLSRHDTQQFRWKGSASDIVSIHASVQMWTAIIVVVLRSRYTWRGKAGTNDWIDQRLTRTCNRNHYKDLSCCLKWPC